VGFDDEGHHGGWVVGQVVLERVLIHGDENERGNVWRRVMSWIRVCLAVFSCV